MTPEKYHTFVNFWAKVFVYLQLKSLWIITSISSRIDFQIVETDDEEIARKQRNRPQVPHPTPRGNHSRQINLFTVPKNIIGASKIQNNYDAIQLFSIAPWYLFFASFLAILTVLFALRCDSEKISVIFLNTFNSKKSDNYYSCNGWKRNNYMGRNTEKEEALNQSTKLKQKREQEKNEHFDILPKIILHFWGTNNILLYRAVRRKQC